MNRLANFNDHPANKALLDMERIFWLATALAVGCSSPADKLEEVRRSAHQEFEAASQLFAAKDYAAAGPKYDALLSHGGLTPDSYSDAAVKRTICWGATNKLTEAMAELQKLEPGAPNLDQVYAARSYILAKQGKVAESRAALAKARQFNRTVQEFKD